MDSDDKRSTGLSAVASNVILLDDLGKLLESTVVPVIGVDNNGSVDLWNSAVARLTGLPESEAIGKELISDICTVLVPDGPVSVISDIIGRALNGEEALQLKGHFRTLAGDTRWVTMNLNPRRNGSGNVLGMFAVIDDVTEMVRIRQENKRYASEFSEFIETANAPIIGVNASGKVNEWNSTVELLTGYTKAEALGKDLVESFVDPDSKTLVRDVLQRALAAEQTTNYEFALLAKSGRKKHILMNATPRRSPQGDVCSVIGIGQDITERLAQEAS